MIALADVFRWIGENEAVLSGIAASIVIAGVLTGPVLAGRRAWRRRRAARSPEPTSSGSSGGPLFGGGRPTLAIAPLACHAEQPGARERVQGLGEELLTALARVGHFDVVAPSPAAEAPAARYTLEGGLRSQGDGARLSIQLVEGESRRPVWTQRFDVPAEIDGDLQDELTGRIAAALGPALRRAEAERARGRPAEELDAWARVNRAWLALQGDLASSDTARQAERACASVLESEPEDALALAVHALARSLQRHHLHAEVDDEEVLGEIRRALALSPEDPCIHHCHAAILGNLGRTAEGARAWERSLELDPHQAAARAGYGISLLFLARPAETVASIDRALALSPRDPLSYHWLGHRALAHALEGQWEQALRDAQESVERRGTRVGWGSLALTLAQAGRDEEAGRAWTEMERLVDGIRAQDVQRMARSLAAEPERGEAVARALGRAARAAGAVGRDGAAGA